MRFNGWWAAVIVWCGVIFYFTASPAFTGDNTHSVIQLLAGLPAPIADTINLIVRKCAHATAFGLLAVLVYMALRRQSKRAVLWAWGFATLYGASDEFHQSLVPDRGPSIVDVGIDSAGALFAVLLVSAILKWRKRA
ncbi:VanZ family protein [Paenibacillus turpanensis]|uniref:VanZ family protein n=1 Tax=Paenibacillus turpanensis TaxID=2689078 RepID=UPI00140B3BC4|nr:VanZ family protein [Paenibacillus turpanensis]